MRAGEIERSRDRQTETHTLKRVIGDRLKRVSGDRFKTDRQR